MQKVNQLAITFDPLSPNTTDPSITIAPHQYLTVVYFKKTAGKNNINNTHTILRYYLGGVIYSYEPLLYVCVATWTHITIARNRYVSVDLVVKLFQFLLDGTYKIGCGVRIANTKSWK